MQKADGHGKTFGRNSGETTTMNALRVIYNFDYPLQLVRSAVVIALTSMAFIAARGVIL